MMEARIREALAQHARREIAAPGARRAAVLLPLYCLGEEYFVLLTRRSEHVGHHKGQISCPGGAIDGNDADALAAALRETEEEVGIAPEDVRVLGALDDIEVFVSGFVITPFVG